MFLHEGLGSIAQWRDFPEALVARTGLPALLYDRRGHGAKTHARKWSQVTEMGSRKWGQVLRYNTAIRVAQGGRTTEECVNARPDPITEDCLPGIRCPLLVIQGKDDEYATEAQVEAIARQAGGPVQTLLLPHCGHIPHHQARDAVLEAMTRFARSLLDSWKSKVVSRN